MTGHSLRGRSSTAFVSAPTPVTIVAAPAQGQAERRGAGAQAEAGRVRILAIGIEPIATPPDESAKSIRAGVPESARVTVSS